MHRVGVGVVGVVDDGDPVRALVDLHPPPAGRVGVRQRLRDRVEVETALERGGDDGERVADVVRAGEPQRDLRRPGRRLDGERRAAEGVQADVDGADVRVHRGPDGDHAGAGAGPHLRDLGVVRVEDGEPVRAQRLDELALGLRDRLLRAELADVGDADVEDDGDVRWRDGREVGEVSDPARAHLRHEEPGGRRDAAHGERHADLAVERVDRRDGLTRGAEDLGEQVLGRRLAGGAGHGDDREGGRPVDDPASQPPERGLDVVDDDAGQVVDHPAGQRGDGASVAGRADVGVPVGVLADPRDVQRAGARRAGVRDDRAVDEDVAGRARGMQRPAREHGDVPQGHRDHAVASGR